MDGVTGGPLFHFISRLAEILQDLAVEKFDLTCRVRGRDKARNAVDGETQALFIRPQGIFSPLPIVDVSTRCIPSDDFSSLVSQRVVLD
jgi:hypothetical protein